MLSLGEALEGEGHDLLYGAFRGRGLRDELVGMGHQSEEFSIRIKIDPIGVYALSRWLGRSGRDLVHTHLSTSSITGGLAARLAHKPSVATVHGLSGKLSFGTVDHLIAVSASVKQHLVDQGVSAGRISVVHNGIAVADMPSPEMKALARRELGLSKDALVLGTTARLTAEKGVDWALRSFATIKKEESRAHFVVFGDGPELEPLKELARALRIFESVTFTGYRTDVRGLLSALDVFVFPTLKEAMGIALVEAMAAGLPVIASNTGGVPEVVTSETGVLVTPFDEAALVRESLAILRSEDSRMLFGRAGHLRAKHEFSRQSMAERTVSVYREVIRRRNRV